MTEPPRDFPSAPQVGKRVEFRSGKERGRGEIIEERASYFAKWRVRGDNGHLYLLSDHEIVKVLNG